MAEEPMTDEHRRMFDYLTQRAKFIAAYGFPMCTVFTFADELARSEFGPQDAKTVRYLAERLVSEGVVKAEVVTVTRYLWNR
jgi:hypothetical protein